MKAPFPWFGGKSQAAPLIWSRLGNVDNYVEPFFGSGAVLLNRPHAPRVETVNDIDGMVCNAWRALAADPDAVAEHASWPVNECDLHARHLWLVERLRDGFAEWLMGDPEHHDAKIAGWWLWGMAAWIGGEFCSGLGPWGKGEDGKLAKVGGGIQRSLPAIGNPGRGVNRPGIQRQIPHLGDTGQGVNRPSIQRQIPHLGDNGRGVNRPDLGAGRRSPDIVSPGLINWFHALQERLRWVRVCCGDWERVTGPSVTYKNLAVRDRGVCGIVLDPPYHASAERGTVYTHDCHDVAAEVTEWALEHGDNPRMRIAVCGFEGDCNERLTEAGWRCEEWFVQTMLSGGYGKQGGGGQQHRDRVWFSPHCLASESAAQIDLFAWSVA